MDFLIGECFHMILPLPCGGISWVIHRVGLVFGLFCRTCGHMVMIPRRTVEKGFRGFVE